jgi:hypothetical protein
MPDLVIVERSFIALIPYKFILTNDYKYHLLA